MSPASKATAPKNVPASRPPAAKKVVSKKKPPSPQKAVPAAKKAAMTKKNAPAPKSAAAATKKQAPLRTQAVPVKAAVGSHAARPASSAKADSSAKAARSTEVTKKAAATSAAKSTSASKGTNGAKVAKKAAPEPDKAVAATRPLKTLGSKPKAPAPVRPKTGPYAKETKFLDEQKELLLADRAIYQEQATSLRAEADSLALEREPGDVQFDEESGEGGTVTVDRERNLALSGQAALAVEEIDYALARLADKTYGYCERCFQPIPKPRLRALPHARLCVACKSGGLSRR